MTTAERTTDQVTGSRFYTHPLTGEQLISVTTVLSETDGKRYLLDWAARLAAEYAIDNLDFLAAVLDGRKVLPEQAADPEITRRAAAVNLAKGEAKRIREVKADAGSYVHSVVEALILWAASPEGTGASLALPVLPDELAGADYDDMPLPDVTDWMIDGFVNFTSDFRPSFLASEMTVFNRAAGIAGTLDMIIALDGYGIGGSGRLVPHPGRVLEVCTDVKTGRHLDATMREQLAAYRRMHECLLPLGEIGVMPRTDAGAVLHLRPEHERGYRLMLVKPSDDAAAWNTFRRAAEICAARGAAKAKPGKVVYPLRADGTIPGPRLADLDGEGYGRALSPLVKAGIPDLEKLSAMTAGECLQVRGVGGRTLDGIRLMLADHGLHLRDEALEGVA